MCGCKQGTCPGNCRCGCRHTPPERPEKALPAEPETVVMVATRYSELIEPDWKVWPGRSFDEVIDEISDRVKEKHRSMEVVEVTVVKRTAIRPVVESVWLDARLTGEGTS